MGGNLKLSCLYVFESLVLVTKNIVIDFLVLLFCHLFLICIMPYPTVAHIAYNQGGGAEKRYVLCFFVSNMYICTAVVSIPCR